jgi:phospholipase/carboxylesterase
VPPVAIVGFPAAGRAARRQCGEFAARSDRGRPSCWHGDQDDLIPAQALFHAASGPASLGVPVEWHPSSGIGHGIDQEGLSHGGEFLARRLAGAR